jgi:hypothetical protein
MTLDIKEQKKQLHVTSAGTAAMWQTTHSGADGVDAMA